MRGRHAAVGLLVVVLALAFAGLAAARASHRTTDPVALALELGERYWGSVPCGAAGPTITFSSQPPPLEVVPTAAHPAGTVVAAWAIVATCAITFSPAAGWSSWLAEDLRFQSFCDLMTHELGHLFGHLDAEQPDPTSITYPLMGAANYNAAPECRHFTLWFGALRFTERGVSLHRA